MKKLLLVLAMNVNYLLAGTTGACMLYSNSDMINATTASTNKEINFVDEDSMCSINTKIVGKPFLIKVLFNGNINMENIKYYVIDTMSGEVIAEPISTNIDEIEFNITKAYKNLSVAVEYSIFQNFDKNQTECGDSYVNIPPYPQKTGVIWKEGYDTEHNPICYEYTKNYQDYVNISTDNFSVKPNKFYLHFFYNKVKTSDRNRLVIQALNNDNEISSNFNEHSEKIDVSFVNGSEKINNVNYSFDIYNGSSSLNSEVSFLEIGSNIKMIINDNYFTNIDDDDTNLSCREISGTSNSVNVIEASKYWGGVGKTNPNNTNININIRQHGIKDMKYNKLSW